MQNRDWSGSPYKPYLFCLTWLIVTFLRFIPDAAAQSINGVCGTTPSTCAAGTVTGSVNNGTSTSWTCLGNNGSNAWCSVADPTLNGTCGTTPSTCATGTVTGSTDNGSYTQWTCLGSNNGSNAWCNVADTIVNGTCGTTASTCATGTVTGSTDNGSSTQWTCVGSNNGSSAYCSVPDVTVNGVCGTTASTCAVGTVTGSTSNGSSTSWTCLGGNNGTNAWCTVSNSTVSSPVNGVCGGTASTCSAGTVTGSSDNGNSTQWTCLGTNGGSSAWCDVSDSTTSGSPVNGTCGTQASTCAAGTVTGSSDNGSSTQWTCLGSNNGSNTWCSVPDVTSNGTCGTTAKTCAVGTVSGASDNGSSTQWTCVGSNNGSNAWCSVPDPSVNGACGATVSTCTVGTPTGTVNNGSSTSWTCLGSNNGSSAWCTVANVSATPQPVNGACGTTASSCAIGTVTGSTDNGTATTWTCDGINGGSNVSCSAADPNPSVAGTCGTTPSTCAAGTVTGSSDNGSSTQWTCLGSGPKGSNAWCSVSDAGVPPVIGTCGSTVNTCVTGTVSGSANNGTSTSWSCVGSGGGASAYCSVVNPNITGVCGTSQNSCSSGTLTGTYNSGYALEWTCAGSGTGTSASCSIPETSALGGTKLGINLGWVLDYSDRQMMFVDVMKDGRGFAQPSHYWDATDYPVPLDANGWPTADFGVVFLSNPGDPLNRPLTTTFPSFFGTYTLSFTGQATVAGAGCCTIQNLNYNPQTNTTTASVVVGPSDTSLSLTFTNTNGGVQNLKLLRPGYALGTTQVFTTQFLNAIAPFSTLRFMDTLETNGNPVTSWAQRTQPTSPLQSGMNGLAWEYVIQLANVTGKDIWVNIPEGVNLADTSPNNYATQLAQLMLANLNPGIHVYLEYSNELWNAAFPQYQANFNSAVSDATSGADPTLNYDNSNLQQYWASRRVMHQVIRMSQLFQNVYGAAAMNTTIRPLFLTQYANPYSAEDALQYVVANFGAPSKFIYGIGAAPYIVGPQSGYSDVPSSIAGLVSGVNSVETGFPTEPFTGQVTYTNLSLKGFADYYGIKSVSYEGGPELAGNTSAVVNEEAESSSSFTSMIEGYLGDWFGCGNDLFMYYELAEPPGDIYGAYEDLSLTTPKSLALTTVAATPLSSFSTCTP